MTGWHTDQWTTEPFRTTGWPATTWPPDGTQTIRVSNSFDGDDFDSSWALFEGGGEEISSVHDGMADITVNAGGVGEAFWFNANRGTLRYKLITGDFDSILTGYVTNVTADGPPTVNDGNFRIAGLMVRDPSDVQVNTEHIGFGCTASAALRVEWKDTVNSVSDFGSVAAATGAGQLRITRAAQVFTMYYRAEPTDVWTTVHTFDRTAGVHMPATVQVGFMCYASVEEHDIRLFVQRFEYTPE